VCSSTYRNKGNLKIHMRRHETKNMFQCQFCDKSFKWDSSLNSHIQAAHNPTGPVFPCDLCDRVFKDKNNQKKHRFTHSNVKPFECKECGKGFIRRDLCAKHKCGTN
jgi:KRAB domain-containing zinc finger protein